MFVRVKRSVEKEGLYEYLQIVESVRVGRSVRQRVIGTLGRLEELLRRGALDGLIESLAGFSQKLRVVEASRLPEVRTCRGREWGPLLVFERLWERQGVPEVLRRLASARRFRFDLERVVFALVLQRLSEPGSDLWGSEWLKRVEGLEGIRLEHLYRRVGWLAEIREELERELFSGYEDLFGQALDLVFLDTTSTYIYRSEETEWVKRGHSRDRRPELPQMILCVAVDRQGWPVAWEVFPGNTADPVALVRVVEKLRRRFRIERVTVVADRAMMSRGAIRLLSEDKEAPFSYILGARMRTEKEVREEVLSHGGDYEEVSVNLKVKEVRVGERRYIVCRNEEEAEKDRAARCEMVMKLEEKLRRGQMKSLIGNRGFRRFLKGQKEALQIDREAVRRDERYDGTFVVRTNLELPPTEIAEAYKGLWRVERVFREEKSTLQVRPIYHQRDEQRIGHIVASFLALRLEVDLQRRLQEQKVKVPWRSLISDLKQLQAMRISLDGRGYLVRTDLEGSAYEAFRAAGVRPPSRVTPLAEPPPPSPAESRICSAKEKSAPSNFFNLNNM